MNRKVIVYLITFPNLYPTCRKQNMQRTVLEPAGIWKIEKVEPTYPLGAVSLMQETDSHG